MERPGPVKVYGISNIRQRVRWYRNLDLFTESFGARWPTRRGLPRYLVGYNFLDDEFVQFPGPKVFCTLEPPMGMTAETNDLIRSGRLDGHLYLCGHPDPEQRMYFPCLPQDRTTLTADVAAEVEMAVVGRRIHDRSRRSCPSGIRVHALGPDATNSSSRKL